MMNLINKNRTRGAYKPHTLIVNLLIRLTTIEHFKY